MLPDRRFEVPGWAKTVGLSLLGALALVAVWQMFIVPPCGRVLFAAECPVGSTATFSNNLGIQGQTTSTITVTGAPTANQTQTLQNVTDTFVYRASTDTFTNKTFDANGTGNSITNIENADISASAEVAVSKLGDGAARQLLQTDAAGTGVEFTSNVDVPGTLDVTGGVVLDSTLTASSGGSLTGTWTDLGAVSTVDINGGTVGGVTLDGTISGTPTWGSNQAITLSTAAQTNITSVGTLTALTLSGDLDMGAFGNRIDLDTDNDTSIRASADDTLMVEIGATDRLQYTAGAFAFQEATTISSVGNLTLNASSNTNQLVLWGGTPGTIGLLTNITAHRGVNLSFVAGDTVNETKQGARFYVSAYRDAGSQTNPLHGLEVVAESTTGSTVNWTATVGIRGITAGTINNAASGTTTGAGAVYVVNHTNPGGGGATANQYGIYIEDLTTATSDYGIYLVGADTAAIYVADGLVDIDGGSIVVGNPTGGDQGDGTINAVAVYDDGALLTDYVTDAYRGRLDPARLARYDELVPDREHKAKFKPIKDDEGTEIGQLEVSPAFTEVRNHGPAREFAQRGNWVFDPIALGNYLLANGGMPQFVTEAEWEAGQRESTGSIIQQLMEIVEVLVLQNYDQAKELDALKAQVAALRP